MRATVLGRSQGVFVPELRLGFVIGAEARIGGAVRVRVRGRGVGRVITVRGRV